MKYSRERTTLVSALQKSWLNVVVLGSVSLATALVHVVFCALCVRFAGAHREPSQQLPRHDAHAGTPSHDSGSRTKALIDNVDRDVMHASARYDALYTRRATRKRRAPGVAATFIHAVPV